MSVSELFVSAIERHPAPQMGDLTCGRGSFLLHSYMPAFFCWSSLPAWPFLYALFDKVGLFSLLHNATATCVATSSERIRMYSCALNSRLERKNMCREMVSCESSSQTAWHWMAQTESSPNIQRWNVTDRLSCIANWGQLNKMHFKVSVLRCISFKTKYVRHPYRVP